ncbi:F-box/LRR-repeat protein 15-like protein, partial [Drosera capensis]
CSQLQDDCLSATTSSCPQIESLILMSCPAIGSAGLFSLQWLRNLTYLDLSYTFLTDLHPIYQACTQLKVLKLQACKYLNESSLEALYTEHALPALQELDLSYGVLGQSAIEELLACCTQLTHLSLNGCENMHDLDWSFFSGQFSELPITFEAPRFPSMKSISKRAEQPHRLLEHLNCVGCQNIKKVFIPPMACWEQLSYLNLSLSTNLKEVDITCSNLCFLNLRYLRSLREFLISVLKLQACKYLNESSLEALYTEHALPALQELDLSYGVLGQSAIEELLACCTQLTHLSLNGCENMHDLDWSFFSGQFSELPITFEAPRFPSMKSISKRAEQPHRLLEHLNCVGCQNIKKVFIPPMACWEQLSYLNLSLSTNLKEVDITCSNLCFLNLSNCCSLEFLKLECPRLASLFLQSCSIDKEAVGSAISRCNMLETLDVRFCPKIYSVCIGRLRMACPSLKRIFSSISP